MFLPVFCWCILSVRTSCSHPLSSFSTLCLFQREDPYLAVYTPWLFTWANLSSPFLYGFWSWFIIKTAFFPGCFFTGFVFIASAVLLTVLISATVSPGVPSCSARCPLASVLFWIKSVLLRCDSSTYQLTMVQPLPWVLLHGDLNLRAMALLILSIVFFLGNFQVSGQRAEDSAEVIDSHVLGDRMSQDVVTIFSRHECR